MENIHTDVGLYLHFLEGFMIKNGDLFFFCLNLKTLPSFERTLNETFSSFYGQNGENHSRNISGYYPVIAYSVT